MASGGPSVPVDRGVAVVATLRDGQEQLGSGYLASGRLVLTAEHCTRNKVTGEPAARLRVARASDGAVANVADVVPDRGLDVAVLQLADDAPWDPGLSPTVFARVDQSHSGVLDDCTGIGFPLFQRDPGRLTRHTSEFHGKVYQTDERESGRLLMREPLIHPGPVTDPADETLTDRGGHGPSPWGGLSGALMFYRGSAIGVVVEHHPRQGDSALRAVGFERIATAGAEIRQCLSLPQLDSLPCVSEQLAVQLPPAGGMPVSETDPRRLGVHAAISVAGVPDDIPPEYVPRDVDAAEHGVRAKVVAAAERSGFVLLVGGSSVGKTRCAVEAAKALLPDWLLIHPGGPDQVAALAAAPGPRMVVWLDELQRYLDGEHGLTGGVMRALLNSPHPAVIIGTLWPDLYTAYMALPAPGSADPHVREREVLKLADVLRIDREFSPAEHDRARANAVRDPRLRVALEATGYGLTQTLAAAPQLVARWQDAKTTSPYAWAVLTAALDAARLGARAPLSADFLRTAAPGYCTSQQQAEAPEDWFEQALAYATVKLVGAAAAFSPAGEGMGRVAGYTVADYLIQHASLERHNARVPASTWDAVLTHLHDPADSIRLAESASSRLLYRYAIALYRHAADVGNWYATSRLVELLAQRGDLDEATQILRARADTDDRYAARWLVDLLAQHGDLDGLRARADAGDQAAAGRLVDLLAERDDLDGLRARADVGDEFAAGWLAGLLAERGDLDGLRARADVGDGAAAGRMAELLIKQGRGGDAKRLRRFGLNPDGSIACR
jgi:Trypsin-like peptidase domain